MITRRCNQKLLDKLCIEAQRSDRLRSHFELHEGQQDKIQRFLNVMQPGSYIPPHMHPETGRWEWFQILQGTLKLLIFSEEGEVIEVQELSSQAETFIIEISPGCWHALVCLEANSAILEMKPGPYNPNAAKHFAQWAPSEGDKKATEIVQWLESAEVGDKFISQE